MDKPLHQRNLFPNFKPELFNAIEPEDLRTNLMDRVLMATFLVDGGDDEGRIGGSYLFDEAAIARIQKFLDDKHRHRVLKWDGLDPVRVINTAGNKTTNKKHVGQYRSVLKVIGCLYAYCIANVIGGTLVMTEGTLGVQPPDGGMISFPVGKVLKYLKFGAEDSLLGFLGIIRIKSEIQPHIEHIRNDVRETLKAKGIEIPDTHRWQDWFDEAGNLTKIVLLDKPEGKPIAEVPVNTGMAETDFSKIPVEPLRAFLLSENGQEVIRHSYTDVDENGNCTRGDFLPQDQQIEMIRNYLRWSAGQELPPEGTALH